MADKKAGAGETVVIKKYANRRLYNTATSAYVTLEDLAKMVREGTDFVVFDAKTNDDLTRQILTQIIFEEESRGEALLPVQFLRQLIGFYGGQMQGVLPSYLEMSLDSFSRQQDQMRGQFSKAFGAAPGAGILDEAVKRNMALFTDAMKMWPSFGALTPGSQAPGAAPGSRPTPTADPLAEMRRQMDEMRSQLDKLSQSPGKGG
ncbi:polyhydroxyalkanoate synthesis repressor PhaR [Brevundimonas sp.]|uniref:polyhydroxyalkanoate synthesis repressor PhaR n=1 Tax=Brevundimonas sp. TaxID=1871086 RepID=UPI00272FA871|nr:polyhydroxyalkanoate synthesis repressor PhaR [Brevundimonas sp.]MDP1913036.1 polyhydroxyalkanoate synthesis repressor PhaR [Brevundimonas sp.]